MRLTWATIGVLSALSVMPAAAQDVYRVSDRVTAPSLTSAPRPEYRGDAYERRIQGTVDLEVDVRRDGTVATVALVRSLYPALDASATDTVKTWRFTPGTRDGQPVTVRVPVQVEFRLR